MDLDASFAALNSAAKVLRESQEKRKREVVTHNIFGALDNARRRKKEQLCGEKMRMNAKMSAKIYGLTEEDIIEKGELFEAIEKRKQRKILVVSDGPMENISPIKAFREADLYHQVIANLESRSYEKPTAIQSYAIPYILESERDILARADTGSGKTAAFLLPLICMTRQWKIDNAEHRTINQQSPHVVVLTPARELALQIYRDALSFCRGTGLRICLAIGEVNMLDSIRMIENGCDILIGTQGRVVHYFFGVDNAGKFSHLNFDNLRCLVLDEVDRVLSDPNYYTMLRKFTSRFKDLHHQVRVIMFSATLDLNNFGMFLRKDHYRIISGDTKIPVDTVVQRFINVNAKKGVTKVDYLLELLKLQVGRIKNDSGNVEGTVLRVPKTIIYVNKKRIVDYLAVRLVMNGFRALSLSGDLPMERRLTAVESIKSDEVDILVTTDVASRGLNIPNVKHVINYDLPSMNFFEYVHRIGRSGRLGHVGRATSFFDPLIDKEIAVFLKDILCQVQQPVPDFVEKASRAIDMEFI
ncbi:unnamed protein product [Bursaphelenchus xylophilus]|uniref:RNA helicase n=1 Tax=Bursaphelenchus xylophilus TaxID=6326 RepID=A0A1I7RVE6_BURXY|nr:unnamed protein product [Bursaphelenchus xylophilus]CAG9086740.1 unnamed protein product [Bursaphelenchus xylophilus]